MTSGSEQPSERPPLVVVEGDATAEEVAALVAVLTAAAGSGAGMPSRPVRHTGWASHERAAGAPRRPGPTAWRASSLPG